MSAISNNQPTSASQSLRMEEPDTLIHGASRISLAATFGRVTRHLVTAAGIFFPNRCGLCFCRSESGFCENCQPLLPWIKHSCQQCGTTLACEYLCGHCQKIQPMWRETIVPFQYIDPVLSQIHGLKYKAKLSVVSPLSRMLASTVIKRCAALPDMIIPVPLHTCSLRKRGYNQSAMIARELGTLLDIPVREDVIVKSRQTESQTRLDQKARRANVKGAFKVVESTQGGSIAVVDDVITSGATMREVCQSLQNNGYDQISIWAIAKTPISR